MCVPALAGTCSYAAGCALLGVLAALCRVGFLQGFVVRKAGVHFRAVCRPRVFDAFPGSAP
eukprot:7894352-Alexandrium_andersonii.AAC.1